MCGFHVSFFFITLIRKYFNRNLKTTGFDYNCNQKKLVSLNQSSTIDFINFLYLTQITFKILIGLRAFTGPSGLWGAYLCRTVRLPALTLTSQSYPGEKRERSRGKKEKNASYSKSCQTFNNSTNYVRQACKDNRLSPVFREDDLGNNPTLHRRAGLWNLGYHTAHGCAQYHWGIIRRASHLGNLAS